MIYLIRNLRAIQGYFAVGSAKHHSIKLELLHCLNDKFKEE
jgi:hypothetical protein